MMAGENLSVVRCVMTYHCEKSKSGLKRSFKILKDNSASVSDEHDIAQKEGRVVISWRRTYYQSLWPSFHEIFSVMRRGKSKSSYSVIAFEPLPSLYQGTSVLSK